MLAEHVRGSARGCDDVVYLTGRIGVGAGILVNGVLLRGHRGFAGEIGHLVLDPNGRLCDCGNRGCAETYIGQGAVLAAVDDPRLSGLDSGSWLGRDGAAGVRSGVEEVRAIAEPLGRTIASLVNLLNPERIVLGGLFAGALEVARAEIEASVRRYAFDAARGYAELCSAGLGEDSSLLGAAELALGGCSPTRWIDRSQRAGKDRRLGVWPGPRAVRGRARQGIVGIAGVAQRGGRVSHRCRCLAPMTMALARNSEATCSSWVAVSPVQVRNSIGC